MTIRTKLTLQFAIIVASILLLSCASIYYFHSVYRSQEFYTRLENKSLSTLKLLIEINDVNQNLLKIIDKNVLPLPEEKITIYNYLNEKIYDSREDIPDWVEKEYLHKIRKEGIVKSVNGEREELGMYYKGDSNRYVVIGSAFDRFGKSKLNNLRIILGVVLLTSIIVTVMAGWFYSGQAIHPISEVIGEVELISEKSLHRRVNERNGRDEIAHLAITFNKMLSRLDSAFEIQRSFVSSASHELRTPLTSITGQLEVTLMNKRNPEKYQEVISSVLEDIKRLNKMTNGLLDLTLASRDISDIKFVKFRIDELVGHVIAEFRKMNPSFFINFSIKEIPESESQLIVSGNESLIKTAFINILDNACKYSDPQPVTVMIQPGTYGVTVEFSDKGCGISDSDLKNVFEPFYRSEDVKNIPGTGLGLSLTKKVVELHDSEIRIRSKVNEGTTVSIEFPPFFKS
jgi:signal transduction histidine kinase